MRRRRFLGQAALAAALPLLGAAGPRPADSQPAAPPPAVPPPAAPGVRGVWLTLNDMVTLRNRARLAEAVAQLAALNITTLYPVVWNGGYAYYPSAVTRRRGFQPFTFLGLEGQDTLAELVREARGRGLRVVPWFEFGFMAPPSSELAQRHPQWLTRRRDGTTTSGSAAGEVVWLNPLRPEVQELVSELVLEVLSGYEVDGIQFDDHFSLPSDFGHDPHTAGRYRRETGREPPAAAQDPAWLRWRADGITAFLERLRGRIRATRPGAIVSVSPNYHAFAYKFQLQDWLTWVRRGLVDEVVVQVYREDAASFTAQLERPELQESRRKVPTGIGIMAGQRTRPVPMERIRSQVLSARERGLGAAFFYYESLWGTGPEPAAERRAALADLFGGNAQATG